MPQILRRTLSLIVAVAFCVNVSGCATPYMTHPEFKERHLNMHSVSVMPPEVDAYVLTFQGDKKRLTDIIPMMEKTTLEQTKKSLTEKGYTLKELDLSEPVLEDQPELRTALFNARKLFNKAIEDIIKHRNKKFIYSIGAEANTFANISDSDVLIFVKEEGVKKSAGEIAKDVVKGCLITAACLLIGAIYIPIPDTCATIVHVAVVDSNDGSILWYTNNACNTKWDPANEKQMAQLITNLIKPFPDSVDKKVDKKSSKKKKTQKLEMATDSGDSVPEAVKTRGVVPMPAGK